MRHLGWVAVAAVAVLTACGTEEASVQPTATPEPPREYTGTFTVLENAEHGPQLCTTVMESYPPQCGGPDVAGWSWDDIEGAESVDGVTWAEGITVTGTWDGETLTLTQPPQRRSDTPADEPADGPGFGSPCEPPAGGWAVVDAATATDAGMQAAMDYASAQPDHGGTWVDTTPFEQPVDPSGAPIHDPTKWVLNVSFTGDLERHEAALRAVWGGALCVSRAERAERDLRAIQDELAGSYPHMSGVGVDIHDSTVSLNVFVDDGIQAEMDERYGPGVVRVWAALRPVE